MPSAGFESAIPRIKRPQTYALDQAATEIGDILDYEVNNNNISEITK
jgi:hypothetical protein